EAKSAGRGIVRAYEPGMQSSVLQRITAAADLTHALSGHELFLEYQPVVATGLTPDADEHVEALVRWNHPTRGIVSPAEFIPLAEETGAIVPLGTWVLLTACEQAVAWQYGGRRVTVRVDVSSRQLCAPDFVAVVNRILKETGAH